MLSRGVSNMTNEFKSVRKHSRETIKKMSNSHKGRYIGKTWEQRYGIEKAKLMKIKLSNSLKGKSKSEEHRQELIFEKAYELKVKKVRK